MITKIKQLELAEAEQTTSRRVVLWAVIGFVLSLMLAAVSTGELISWSTGIGQRGGSAWLLAVAAVFWAAVAVVNGFRWSVFVALSISAWQQRRTGGKPGYFPFVSIVVPCFNESDTIRPAMQSLLALDYPKFEIVVVNDGSTDDTLAKAKELEGQHGNIAVRVYDKPNGGKWSAHNFGFERAGGDLILCVDADSRLAPSSLRRMVTHLADPSVAGVAGQVRVRNRSHMLTKLQALEYMMANGIVRLGQSCSGSVLVVPGPIGLFRRSVLESIIPRYGSNVSKAKQGQVSGPYSNDTFAEDFDLSVAILCHGGRIVYEPDAVSRTKAPDNVFALVNQRYRWLRGSMQVVRKFFHRLLSDRDAISVRVFVWVVSTYSIDLVLSPLTFFLGVAFLLLLAWSGAILHLLLLYSAFLMMYLTLGIFVAAVHREKLETLSVLPVYHFYSALLYGAWVISLLDEIRGRKMRW